MCGHAETSRQGLPAFVTDQVLTPKERDAIRQRTAAGEPVKELAAEYQVSTDTIRNHAA
jgi:DNA-binding NarL/FixJ family response regulator